MERRVVAGLAATFVALAIAGDTAVAGGSEKPFPVDHTQILAGDGTTYVVDGRVHIGKSTVIKVLKDTKIVGKGEHGGIIELEGQLWICGVSTSKVTLQDITIELCPKFDTLHTDMVSFTGKSGGVVTPKDVAVDGRVFVDSTDFALAATVDVTMLSNWIDLQHCSFGSPVHVKAVDPEGSPGNKVRLMVMNCGAATGSAAFQGGLTVERVFDVTVRTNVIGGGTTSFVDCGSVAFDTNYVRCKTLRFVQTAAGRFAKTWMSKCDVQCEKIELTAPVDPKKTDTMPCDKCWFNGETKEKAVCDKYFVDHAKNPESGVTVKLSAIEDKPLQLAGSVTR